MRYKPWTHFALPIRHPKQRLSAVNTSCETLRGQLRVLLIRLNSRSAPDQSQSNEHSRLVANVVQRYRLRMRNASDDIHPIHLHRHSFELTSLAGKPSAGILKDVVMVGGYQKVEIDFIADNPGLTLFHCHQQLHMDFGFMTLFDYV